jgi:hypothetical protein
VSYVGRVTLQLIFETKSWNQSHGPNQRELSIESCEKLSW